MSARQGILISAVVLGAWLTIAPAGVADNAPPVPDDVEVLGRGPVHEAFAQPIDPKPQPSPVVPKPPPDPITEVPPKQKPEGDNVQWLSGYWAWDDDKEDYIWVSGLWRAPPPGRQWVPGHWVEVDDGWQRSPGFWAEADRKELEYVPVPPETPEKGPTAACPGDDYIYVPGHWVYRDGTFVWEPGYWALCDPDWVWVPPYYLWTPCGCLRTGGYWDYPLRCRGPLYAPVYLPPRVYRTSNYSFTPCYCVCHTGLLGSLFVRPGCCCYYFGDWYGPTCLKAGFTPWMNWRLGCCVGDPLFAHCAHFAPRATWARDVQALFAARHAGDAPRPPRTLEQQSTLVTRAGSHDVAHVTMLAPPHQAAPAGVRLQSLAARQHEDHLRAAQQVQAAAALRHQEETRLLAKPRPGGRETSKVKLNLPPVSQARAHPSPPPPAPAKHGAQAAKIPSGELQKPPRVETKPPRVETKPAPPVVHRPAPAPTTMPLHAKPQPVHQTPRPTPPAHMPARPQGGGHGHKK